MLYIFTSYLYIQNCEFCKKVSAGASYVGSGSHTVRLAGDESAFFAVQGLGFLARPPRRVRAAAGRVLPLCFGRKLPVEARHETLGVAPGEALDRHRDPHPELPLSRGMRPPVPA